jgi:hypothetical protein
MGALVKNPVTQLLQVPMPGPTAALFAAESLARISTLHSKEIGDFSHFLPVIILIHESAVEKLAVREMPNNNSSPRLLNRTNSWTCSAKRWTAWGYENYPYTRTVDNHILRLRQKLEPHPLRSVHFRTVHGTGHKFLP